MTITNRYEFRLESWRVHYLGVAFLLMFNPNYGQCSDFSWDLMLFPHSQGIFRLDNSDQSNPTSEEFVPGINIFGSLSFGSFHLLGEYFLDQEEQELERMQIGWNSDTVALWLGRVHNPTGYWNTQFHHGLYFQTSISRPGIVEYEDEGGLLPSHLSGLLLTLNQPVDDGLLQLTLTLGIGPEYSDQLETWNLLKPNQATHGRGITARLNYQPKQFYPTEFGLAGGYYKIPASSPNLTTIHQWIFSLYGNWQQDRLRIIAAGYLVNNRLERPSNHQFSTFFNAYLQPEFRAADAWTLYGRVEGTLGENGPYQQLFPDYVQNRILGGLRFGVYAENALTLEVARTTINNDSFAQITLQWSALFE